MIDEFAQDGYGRPLNYLQPNQFSTGYRRSVAARALRSRSVEGRDMLTGRNIDRNEGMGYEPDDLDDYRFGLGKYA